MPENSFLKSVSQYRFASLPCTLSNLFPSHRSILEQPYSTIPREILQKPRKTPAKNAITSGSRQPPKPYRSPLPTNKAIPPPNPTSASKSIKSPSRYNPSSQPIPITVAPNRLTSSCSAPQITPENPYSSRKTTNLCPSQTLAR